MTMMHKPYCVKVATLPLDPSGRSSARDDEHPCTRPVFLGTSARFGMGLYAFRIALSLFSRAAGEPIYVELERLSFRR
jgi:hypothetical protein